MTDQPTTSAPRTAAALVDFTKAGLALGQHFVVCLTCRPHTGLLQPCPGRDDLIWRERVASQVLAAAMVDERVLERLTAAEAVVEAARMVRDQSRFKGQWLETPAYGALAALDAALAALEQEGKTDA